MESSLPEPVSDPAAARVALEKVARVRGRVACRIRAPWWYHVGLGASVVIMFASFGNTTVGVVIGAILLPAALIWLAKRATGVGVDRYRIPPGAGRANVGYMVLFLIVVGVVMALDIGLGLDWAPLVAGAVMFLPTVLLSYRLDLAYQRELRSAK